MWVQAAIMAAQAVSGMIGKQDAEHEQYENDLLAATYRNTEIRTEQLNTNTEATRRKREVGRQELSLRGKVATSSAARGIGGEAVNQAMRQVEKESNHNRSQIEQQVASYTRSSNQQVNTNQKKLQNAYNKLTFKSTFDFIHDAAAPAVMMAYLGEMATDQAVKKAEIDNSEINNQVLNGESAEGTWNHDMFEIGDTGV